MCSYFKLPAFFYILFLCCNYMVFLGPFGIDPRGDREDLSERLETPSETL